MGNLSQFFLQFSVKFHLHSHLEYVKISRKIHNSIHSSKMNISSRKMSQRSDVHEAFYLSTAGMLANSAPWVFSLTTLNANSVIAGG